MIVNVPAAANSPTHSQRWMPFVIVAAIVWAAVRVFASNAQPREHKTEKGYANAGLDGWYKIVAKKRGKEYPSTKAVSSSSLEWCEALQDPDGQRNIKQAMRECHRQMCVE